MESIFQNSNFYNLSDPQSTWLYDVAFYSVKNNSSNSYFIDWCNKNIIITSIGLPSYHTETVTKKYFGSEKSYPVVRTYGGECTKQFDVITEVILDFSEITFISSFGLKVILELYKKLKSQDGVLKLKDVSEQLKISFNMVGFNKFLVFE